jgi:hypothetical protein
MAESAAFCIAGAWEFRDRRLAVISPKTSANEPNSASLPIPLRETRFDYQCGRTSRRRAITDVPAASGIERRQHAQRSSPVTSDGQHGARRLPGAAFRRLRIQRSIALSVFRGSQRRVAESCSTFRQKPAAPPGKRCWPRPRHRPGSRRIATIPAERGSCSWSYRSPADVRTAAG